MNCKTLAKSSAKFLAAALMTVSAFAQNAVPQFPVLKSPTSAVTRNVALNGVVLVRQVLADLMVGDYVDT